jgi:hypothetical protein
MLVGLVDVTAETDMVLLFVCHVGDRTGSGTSTKGEVWFEEYLCDNYMKRAREGGVGGREREKIALCTVGCCDDQWVLAGL